MAPKSQSVLGADQLNDADEAILDELYRGRASPSYLTEQTKIEQTYINQRLRRLEEHGHVENLARGLWELAHDPRDGSDLDDVNALRDQMHEWKNRWHNAHQELEGTKELLEECREELEDARESSDVDVDEARDAIRRALRDDAWGPVEDAASYLEVQTDE